jgi:hypothetical protein
MPEPMSLGHVASGLNTVSALGTAFSVKMTGVGPGRTAIARTLQARLRKMTDLEPILSNEGIVSGNKSSIEFDPNRLEAECCNGLDPRVTRAVPVMILSFLCLMLSYLYDGWMDFVTYQKEL